MNLYHLEYLPNCPAVTPGDARDRAARRTDDGVAAALAPFGVTVVEEMVCPTPGAAEGTIEETSEALIDVTRPIDLPLIEHVLRTTGYRLVRLAEANDRDPAAA